MFQIPNPKPDIRGEIHGACRTLIVLLEAGKLTKEEALLELIDLVEPEIKRLLYLRYAHVDFAVVEDLFQTFVVRLYNAVDLLRPDMNFWPYLASIALNLKIDYLRKLNRHQKAFPSLNPDASATVTRNLASTELSVEQQAILNQVLGTLSEEDQELAWLYWGEDWTLMEIAKEFSNRIPPLPVTTIQGRIRRIRKAFKKYNAAYQEAKANDGDTSHLSVYVRPDDEAREAEAS